MKKHFIFLLICFQIGYTQTHIYQHYGVDEGLPSSEVYDVYQDKLGYIWFATDKGLSRYNGYEFDNYTTKDGLPGNTILRFYPQEDGKIYCIEHHSNTLFYFDEVFAGFKTYPYNNELKKHLSSRVVIKSISVNKKGMLILGGYGIKGFIKITPKGEITEVFNKDLFPDIPFAERASKLKIGLLNDGKAFGAIHHDYKLEAGLFSIPINNPISSRFDFKKINEREYAFIDYKLGIASKSGKVTYIESDQYPIGIKRINNTMFWVGYYSKGAEIRTLSGEVTASFLPNNSVSNFLIDAEGSYWFTTLDAGVFHIKNPDIKVFTEDYITSLVKDNRFNLYTGNHKGDISRIHKQKQNLLYKGANNGAAFVEFNKTRSEVYGSSDSQLQNLSDEQQPITVYSVRKLAENILDPLVNVASVGYNIVENDSIKFYSIGLRTEDICKYNDTTFIATPFGLYFQNNNSVQPHFKLPMLKTRLYDIDINKQKNKLYIASQGKGIIVFGDTIYNISKRDGLTNAIVSEVHIENDSTLWACTNTGLNRIIFNHDNTFAINTLTKSDGLLSNNINDVEIVNDTVWVATKSGLCFFKKEIFHKKKALNILSLNLKEVRVNNSPVTANNIKLQHNQNSIDFKLEAISNRNSEEIAYFYRLKEIDSSWTKTKNRIIRFPSLSPGSYTFEAKASVFNNHNNLLTSYAFKITPPFWKSWWFYSICFLLFSALVYLFFRIRVLTYNQDVFRELIRLAIKRLKRNEQFFKFRANGEDFKIPTSDILYINSQGNYLDIITKKKTYTIRCKIGEFINKTPDALEYLRIHRSYIIRIDQVSSKGKNWVVIKDHKIPVGETYLSKLDNIQF